MATVLSYIVLLTYIAGELFALQKSELFPFGSETYLPSKDDVSSPEVHLTVPIIFYGTEYRSIYVNDNGLLSFLTEVPLFFNDQFLLEHPLIAPLYSDVDIRSSGRVYYRETQAPELLDRAARDIRNHFSSLGSFQPRSLFIATWDGVGYYDRQKDKINTFQVVVASDGEDSCAYFLYPSGGVQWTRGEGKKYSFPDTGAQAGFVSGDGRLYTLRDSGTEQIRNFDRLSNAKEAGVWMFHIGRPFGAEGNVVPADLDASDDHQDEKSRVIRSAYPSLACDRHSYRVDHTDGGRFCCVCQDGFFGNGKYCLPKDLETVVIGFVRGTINGVQLDQTSLHVSIDAANGRTRTDMIRVPPAIASDLQVLSVLGVVVGWLVAVSRSGAPNGFMITGGVFNRTTEVDFPQSGHHVLIEETFFGFFVHQVKLQGTVPSVPLGTRIQIPDYEEEYTKIATGKIRSHSSRFYRLEGNSLEVPFTVDQSISYFPNPDCEIPMTKTQLKVTMNIITYVADQETVRYSITNEISPLGVAVCRDPGFIENGLRRYANGFESSMNEYFQEGQSVVYGCMSKEFALRGPSFLTCKPDGEWSSPLPECVRLANCIEKVYCKNPGTVANARMLHIPHRIDPDAIQKEYPEGSSLQYSCEEGFILMGPPSLTCENTSSWSSATLPTCVPGTEVDLTCDDPGRVLNGRRLYYAPGQRSGPGRRLVVGNEMEEYPAGSVLEHSCDKGFRLQGSVNLTCEWTGFWSANRPRCDADCGIYSPQVTSRIRGGEETVVGEWPWIVSISLLEGDCSRFVCGGAVFNTHAVITAAHCLERNKTYILHFGKHHFRSDKDHLNVLVRMSSRVITHPDYSPRSFDSDIGLVMFKEPIEYSARVQPICLPTIDTTVRNIRTGKVGFVSGWGDTERDLPADTLLFASLPILSSQECMESYSKQNLTVVITDNMFCAGYFDGTYSVCEGDSGSPFVFLDNLHNRYVLEGLVSYVVRKRSDAQKCGLPGRFAIFTKVFRFLPWLYQTVE